MTSIKKSQIQLLIFLFSTWIIAFFLPGDFYKFAELLLMIIYVITLYIVSHVETLFGEFSLFLVTYGVFLCSYPFLDFMCIIDIHKNPFFNGYDFSNSEIINSINVLGLTLLVFLFSFFIWCYKPIHQKSPLKKQNFTSSSRRFYLLFTILGIFTLLYRVYIGMTLISSGLYVDNFSSDNASLGGIYSLSFIPFIFQSLFYVCLALENDIKTRKRAIFFYGVVAFFQVLNGQRGPFIVDAIFLIWYYNKYISLISNRLSIFFACFFMILANAISCIRNNMDFNFNLDFLLDFFVEQGVSFGVIANTMKYYDNLLLENTIWAPYFLGPIHKYYSFLFDKLTFRTSIFGHGQTQEALQGSSYLGWKLTDLISSYQYSIGRGTGSSFVAENYLFYGFFGVIVLTILMIWLIAKIRSSYNNNYLLIVYFIVVKSLIYSPRNNFWIFLSDITTVTVVLLFLYLFIPKVFNRIKLKIKMNNTPSIN